MDATKDPTTEPMMKAMEPEEEFVEVLAEPYEFDGAVAVAPETPAARTRPAGNERSLVAVIRRRKRAFFIGFLLAFAVCALYGFSSPYMYRSKAVIQFDTGASIPSDAIKKEPGKAPKPDPKDRIATQHGPVKTTAVALGLVEKMNLDRTLEFGPDSKGMVASAIAAASAFFADLTGIGAEPGDGKHAKERVAAEIVDRITVQPQPESGSISVWMDATDPGRAQSMLKGYLDLYREREVNSRRTALTQVEAWYRTELKKAEDWLQKPAAAPKQTAVHEVPARREIPLEQLVTSLNRTLDEFARDVEQRIQKESARVNVAPEWRPLPAESPRANLVGLREQLAELETKYLKMSEFYADNYPPVAALRKQIQSIRTAIEEGERRLVPASAPAPPPAVTPVASSPPASAPPPPLRVKPIEVPKVEPPAHRQPKQEITEVPKQADGDMELYRGLVSKYQQVKLALQSSDRFVSVVDGPTLPVDPVGLPKALFLLVGTLLGLAGGVLAALVAERRDRTLHSPADVENRLDLKCLGIVPDVGKLRKLHQGVADVRTDELLAAQAPGTPVAEAIHNVRASLGLSGPDFSLGSLVIAATAPDEGSTFVAVSLAAASSSEEKRVLVVDANLRKPSIGAMFGHKDDSPGLTTLLTQEDVKLFEVLHRSKIPGFYYIAAGPAPADPVGHLVSDRMVEIIRRFKRMFELVVFDTPPLQAFADARIVAAHTDGLLLVAREGNLPAEIVGQAASMIPLSGGRIIGAVLNRTTAMAFSRGNPYFDYGGPFGAYFKRERSRKTRTGTATGKKQ